MHTQLIKKYAFTFFLTLGTTLSVFQPAIASGDDDQFQLATVSNHLSLASDAQFRTTLNSALLRSGFSASKKKWFEGMRYSGNARFYTLYRDMKYYYSESPDFLGGLTMPVNISAGDGMQQPLLLLAMEGNPSKASMFKFELNFDHLLLRQTNRTNIDGRLANLFVIFNFEAGVDTRIGHLNLIAGGGINWYRMSPATFWGYQYRDDLFQRYPWEPEGHDFDRYNAFYYQGDIPRDARFGMQPTQGFILEGEGLPGGFDAAIIYGKNTQTGGYQSYLTRNPQAMFATRLSKELNKHRVGINYFDQSGRTENALSTEEIVVGVDSFYVQNNYQSTVIATADVRLNFSKWTLFAEGGAGSFLSNLYNEGLRSDATAGLANYSNYKRGWDETIFVEATSRESWYKHPTKLMAYRVGAGVINQSSSTYNTSIENAKSGADVPDQYNLGYWDGMVTDVAQITNNRQGASIMQHYLGRKLRGKLGIGFAQELNNLAGDTRNGARASSADSTARVPFTNSITFHHRLNGISRSRFSFYRRFTGPYSRINTNFMRSFENVAITDTVVDYKKSFSNLELEAKYKFRVDNKELIVMNFMDFSSVQENFSPVPVFTDKAFVRYFYEELLAFYAIAPKVTLVGFGGFEMTKGNSRTELADADGNMITDANGRPIADAEGTPINQRGFGAGLGLDYNFDARASVHVRNRWYTHKDLSFSQDRFQGNELTIEFKKFF